MENILLAFIFSFSGFETCAAARRSRPPRVGPAAGARRAGRRGGARAGGRTEP